MISVATATECAEMIGLRLFLVFFIFMIFISTQYYRRCLAIMHNTMSGKIQTRHFSINASYKLASMVV